MLLLQSCTFEKSFPHTLPALQAAGKCPLSPLFSLQVLFIQCSSKTNASSLTFLLTVPLQPFKWVWGGFQKTLKHSQMQTNSQIPPVRSTWHEAPWELCLERQRCNKNSISGCLNPFPSCKVRPSQRQRKHLLQSCWKKSVLRSYKDSSAKFRLCSLYLQWYHGLVSPIPGGGKWDGLCYLLTLGSPRGILHALFMKTKLAHYLVKFSFKLPSFLVLFFSQNHKGKILHVDIFLRNEHNLGVFI